MHYSEWMEEMGRKKNELVFPSSVRSSEEEETPFFCSRLRRPTRLFSSPTLPGKWRREEEEDRVERMEKGGGGAAGTGQRKGGRQKKVFPSWKDDGGREAAMAL